MVYRVNSITGLSPWYSGAEREHQKAFNWLIRPGGVVVDVGANWGQHTLYFSRLVGVFGRVIAVEPYPPAFAELEWHVAANHCTNVNAEQIAVGDRDGADPFFPGDSASTGRLMSSAPTSALSDAIRVKVRTLDSLVETVGLRAVTLVKIDVEGAEGRVLCGAEQVTARFRPIFVVDLHTPKQDVFVARWLTERGYRLRRLGGPPILRTDAGWPEQTGVWGSILALPAGFKP